MKATQTKSKISLTLPDEVLSLLEEMCFLDRRNKSREITHLIELYAKNPRLKKQHEADKEHLARMAACVGLAAPISKLQGDGAKSQIIQFPGRALDLSKNVLEG
ncbi:MAG: hypothetical protein LBU85_08815 [Treponema sp.]|jgi:hypothetical protein|nr:hypothetical protein [Treponema sp.]